MAAKKKATRAKSAKPQVTVAGAKKDAMKALDTWSSTADKALKAAEKDLAAAKRKWDAHMKKAKAALERVRKAKTPAAKAKAQEARQKVLADKGPLKAEYDKANEAVKAARLEAYEATVFAKGVENVVKTVDKAVAKKVAPKKKRRRRKAKAKA